MSFFRLLGLLATLTLATVLRSPSAQPTNTAVHEESSPPHETYSLSFPRPGQRKCIHPQLEAGSPALKRLWRRAGPAAACPRPGSRTMFAVNGSTVVVTGGDGAACVVRELVWESDRRARLGSAGATARGEYSLRESDMGRVECPKGKGQGQVWDLALGVRYNASLAERTCWRRVSRLRPASLGLNLLVLGLGPVSRVALPRLYPLTQRLLGSLSPGPVLLHGYNVAGDSVLANLVPFLTGLSLAEFHRARPRPRPLPFLWQAFRQSGYITGLVQEPAREKGVLVYPSPPTHHYLRPQLFHYQAWSARPQTPKSCRGQIAKFAAGVEYIKRVWRAYRGKPRLMVGLVGEGGKGRGDQLLRDLLAWLRDSGSLNDTVVLLLADRGATAEARASHIGRLVYKMPLAALLLPPSLSLTHPHYWANLQLNARRLTTPYDLHATLLSLLSPSAASTPTTPSHRTTAYSLLEDRVPEYRSCEEARVEPGMCGCVSWESLDLASPLVLKAAFYIINEINWIMAKHTEECEPLYLHELLYAHQLVPPRRPQVLQLQLITRPGEALFEFTLRVIIEDGQMTFDLSSASRMNPAGRQAHCMTTKADSKLRIFCYCKRQLILAVSPASNLTDFSPSYQLPWQLNPEGP